MESRFETPVLAMGEEEETLLVLGRFLEILANIIPNE